MSGLSGVVSLDPTAPDPHRSALNIRSRDGRWLVAWSGRLDNREELRARFGLPQLTADGDLVAEALAAGGIRALGEAVGDFASAAWDGLEGRLWLARDAIGFRPLFYCRQGDRIWFATEMRVLTTGPARGAAPNEGLIGEVLAGQVVSAHETPLQGITRVLPAEALGFERAASAPRRVELWRPPTRLPPRRADADLIHEFQTRLLAVVTAAVGTERRVSAQLSGGLDSTAVAAAATSILGAPPETYSLVYPSMPIAVDGEMLDETPFVDAAARALGARSTRFDPLGPDGLTRDDFLRVLAVHGELPDLPVTDALNFPLFTRAAADGHRVMLTGLGGDYWLSGSLSRLPALLRRGRLVAAWRFSREARRRDTLDATPADLRAHLLTRLTPAWAKAISRPWRSANVWPAWLPDAFTSRIHLGERMRRLSARVPRVDDEVLQDSLLRLTLSEGLLTRESLFRASNDAGIDVRHPMLDRRFVEFVLTLPDDLRLRAGETRYILRRALPSLVPAAIRDRRSKGDGSTLIGAALSLVLAGSSDAGTHAAARGWIDAARLAPEMAPFVAPGFRARRPQPADDLVWAAVAVDRWLASRGA